ncbi:hypothetical protein HHI36_012000 [Cryptolaemus montrouzieri]|uniref:Peptidase S1 domain-containing protein n=1 Tax=Cryptolaemus montrouzieri TaxID=559131 RepID=A0ABD2NCZ6_9CUCU
MRVRVGSSYSDRGGYQIAVDSVSVHPFYNEETFDYDIAILKLEDSLLFSDKVQPVSLAKQGETVTSLSDPIVSGWGKRSFSSNKMSNHLMYVSVPLITNKECQKQYISLPVTDRMMCAGYAEGKKDACGGDSGGPLVLDEVQIGIVSWGVGCAYVDSPGVYASVSHLRNFIDQALAFTTVEY